MSKQTTRPEEKSKMDKLKNFLGIGGSSSAKASSANMGGARMSSKEFIFTAEMIQEISKDSPANHRRQKLRDLCDIVRTKQLEDNALQVLWMSVVDLLEPQVTTEDRHLALTFLQRVVSGQYAQLGIMRVRLFETIKAHTIAEDLSYRLELFRLLCKNGKDLEYIEEETGPFLLEWMPTILGSSEIKVFLELLINVFKYNAAYIIDEETIAGLVFNICRVPVGPGADEKVKLCLKALDTIVCYSYLPSASLGYFIVYMCQVVSIEAFCQDAWQLMRKLLGTHLGHSAIYRMCCILQDERNATESGEILLRGAVFFIGMALWGSMRVTSLNYPPSAVLPSFRQALMYNASSAVAYEVTLSIQRLISKYGKDQQMVTWDILLDIIDDLLKQVQTNPGLLSNVHDLLTSIENLHNQDQFTGSPDRFFSIIETCAEKRPESSILTLVAHKAEEIRPTRVAWKENLNHLVDRYFRLEVRTSIRVKVLDVLSHVLVANKHLYEDDLIQAVVVTHFGHLELEQDAEVRVRSVQLLVDLGISCQTSCCLDILDNIRKVATKTQMPAPSSPNVVFLDSGQPKRQPGDLEDVRVAITGLVNMFKVKLYQWPGSHALRIYELLVGHLEATHRSLQVDAAGIRREVLECLLALRADSLHRLGLDGVTKDGHTRFSAFVLCAPSPQQSHIDECMSSSSPPASPMLPTSSTCHSPTPHCHCTVIPYADAFRCISLSLEMELDWTVLKMILQKLMSLLHNKTLLMAAHRDDIVRFCSCLCLMVSNHRQLHLPEKLLNRPVGFTALHFHGFIFPVLTSLVSYHDLLDKKLQRDIISCLEFGIVSKCARICVQALSVCMLEMQDVMMRQLPSVLVRLSQITATSPMAIPLMEFLSSLIHLPQLYANFVEEQYLSIFAIALPYTNPSKYSHYTVSLAYHVIAMWFLKCRLPLRKGFVGFIVKGLQANVLRQFEENLSHRRLTQDSTERSRTQSLNDENLRSKSRAAAAVARTKVASMGHVELDETLSTFHKELTETCIDMMARYTFSGCTSLPNRCTVAKFLLEDGQSQTWLLGNKLITITTSGGSKMTKAGLCNKCLCRVRGDMERANGDSKTTLDQQGVVPESATGVRRRHRSAAVQPRTHEITLKPSSQDDILLHRQGSREESPIGGELSLSAGKMGSHSQDRLDGDVGEGKRRGALQTKTEQTQAMDNVLMGLRAKPSDKSIFSPLVCNCWVTMWAEVYIRSPTGDLSWIMRIQNEDQDLTASTFPDLPLANISSLLRGSIDHSQEFDELLGEDRKIDSSSLPENEYESLLEEHFNLPSTGGATRRMYHERLTSGKSFDLPVEDDGTVCGEGQDEDSFKATSPDEPSQCLKKSLSFPDLSPVLEQKLYEGNANSDLQDAYKRAANLTKTTTLTPLTRQRSGSTVNPATKTCDSKSVTDNALKSSLSHESPSPSPSPSSSRPSSDDLSSQKSRGCSFTSIPEEDGHQVASASGVTGKRPASVVLEKSVKWPPVLAGSGKEAIHGGMSPSFLFLQLYHSHMFGMGDDRPVALPSTPVIERAVKLLDLVYPFETHKIGIIYVQCGQTNDQVAILSNVCGSSRYVEFLQGLGHLIYLKECQQKVVYLGGLNPDGSDGEFTYAWHDEFMQVIFHVASLMPNKESDPNCNDKKRHIGNDFVTITYNDSTEDYSMGTLSGQVNYVNIVIKPLDNATNAVTVQAKPDIREIVGQTDTKIISDTNLAFLVRQMAIHANLASTILQKQQSNPKDPYASNWLERLRQIKRIHSKARQDAGSSTATRERHAAADFMDYV